jgi:hypothetical protein
MSTIHWTNHSGGNWSTAANWSTGLVPPSTGDVLVDATPAGYTVSVDNTYTIDSVGIIAGVTVTTTYGHSFTITDTSASSANAGTITVANYTDFYLGGTITNTGLIAIAGAANTATLHLTSATVTLLGAGQLSLADNTVSVLRGAAGSKLVNVGNAISGGGTIGLDGMAIDNQSAGIINATGVVASMVLTGIGTFTNEGLIEASGKAGLALRNITIANTGTVQGVGGVVYLENTTLAGGTLNGAEQTVYGYFGSVLDGSAHAIVSNGTVTLGNYSALTLLGTITNNGLISDLATSNATSLTIGSTTVDLQGGGNVTLADSSLSVITGGATNDLLANINNTIAGAGQFGNGQLNIDNQASGVINATGANALIVNTGSFTVGSVTHFETFTTEGLLEATNPGTLATTGGLIIYGSTIDNTGNGNSGKIEALGTNTHVNLQHGAAIKGGTLITAAGDVITVDYGSAGSIDGTAAAVTLTAKSVLQAANYTTLDLLGTIVNNGTIFDGAAANESDLVGASPTLTLTGGGLVSLNDQANGYAVLKAGTSGNKLVNVNNTIQGAGTIGPGGLVIDNQAGGVINANGVNHSLVLTGSTGFTNEGLIESTSASGLEIRSIGITNTGTIQASGGGKVYLENSTITGGTLVGPFTTNYGQFSNTLDGSASAVTSSARSRSTTTPPSICLARSSTRGPSSTAPPPTSRISLSPARR